MKQKVSKILSLICALALIVSCVSVGFVVSAAGATVTYISDTTLPTDLGTNHFVDSTVAVSETGKSAYAGSNADRWTTLTTATGEAPAAQTFYGAKNATSSIFTADNNTVGQKVYYLQMTVTLPKTVNNPTTFHYATNLKNNAQLSDYYEIFASSKESDLYESKNSLGIIETTDTTTYQHRVDISGFELSQVKYFGIRFYHRPYSNYGIQISSIGLYGGNYVYFTSESNDYTAGEECTIDGNKNLLIGAENEVSATAMVDGVATTVTGSLDAGCVDGLYSSNSWARGDKNKEILTTDNNWSAENPSTEAFVQMEFTIAAGVINNPEKILFINSIRGTNSTINSARYDVFASSDKNKLYEKPIYSYESSTGTGEGNTHIIDISDLKLQKIKYVAVRFYNRNSTNTSYYYMQTVSEFGIFGGEYSEDKLDNLTVNSDLTADYEEANGKNLLVYSQFTSSSSSDITYSTKPDFSVLTDGSVAVGNTIQPNSGRIGEQGDMLQTESYLQIKFDFYSAVSNPETLRIAFGATDTEGSASLHYAVYFLADGETIETTEKVYNYQVSKRENGEHILALADLGQIKSVVVRFYESESEALVISEIGLYGGSAELYISGSATSKDDDYTSVYGENLFKNASLTFSATDGTNVYDAENSVNLSRYTVITDNKSNLTTSTTSTHIKFAGLTSASNDYEQTAAYIDMTFAMNGVINNPEKILLAFTVDNIKEQFKPSKHYAIYASDSLDNLYSGEPIVHYQNKNRQGVEHLHNIKAKNLEGIKYIGIRWYERMSMDLLMFTEVALYGGEYQSALSLAGSIFLNAEEELDNYDIQYRVSAADLSYKTITDMGMVAGFKFTLEEKNQGVTVNKAWATENLKKGVAGSTKFYSSKLVGAENLYFHILNSGSKDALDDRSGYAIYAIGYVTFTDTRGREISLWSNTMTKSSKQISRTQARDYYEDEENSVAQQIAASNYADYNFSDGSIDITKVREYVAEVYDVINSIYVDQTNGLDSNTGSEEAPLKTLDKAAENGKIIKVIGAYTLDGTERIGNADHAVTIKGADANAAINATTMIFDGDTTIDNITLNFQGAIEHDANDKYTAGLLDERVVTVSGLVYADYNTVTFGSGVITKKPDATYAHAYIYAGKYDNKGNWFDTNITVNGGEWYKIFGNSDKQNGTVTNSHVTVGGSAKVHEVFGGGHFITDSEVTFNSVTNSNVTINGGTIYRVIGGGHGSKADVTSTNVVINGGTSAEGMNIFGGTTGSAQVNSTKVTINGGYIQQVFGGSQGKSVAKGSNPKTEVYVLGGTITRRIYGGCYSESSGSVFVGDSTKVGTSTVVIGSEAKITLTHNELDKGIFAISRHVDSSHTNAAQENSILKFVDQAAYEKYQSKIGQQDLLGPSYGEAVYDELWIGEEKIYPTE